MEQSTQTEVASILLETTGVIKDVTASNSRINKNLVLLLLATNIIWASIFFATVYVYFTTDYDYYGENVNINENRNINENGE